MSLMDVLLNRTTTVGIDIGVSSIKLVQMVHTKKKSFLKVLNMRDIPEDTISEKEIINRDALVETIEALVIDSEKISKIKIKDIVFSISRSASVGIFIDRLEGEKLGKGENLTEFISHVMMNRNYGGDGDGTTFDFKVLKKEEDELGENLIIDALVCTVRDEIVKPYISVMQEIGLNPIVYDVDVFALYNSWANNVKLDEIEGTQILLQIGEYNTAVILVKSGVFYTSRTIAIGTNQFILALQSHLDIPKELCIQVLKGNLPEDVEEEAVDKILFYTAEEFSSYVDSTLKHFKSSILKTDSVIDKVYLSGGGATIKGFNSYLQKKFDIPVYVLDPFENVDIDEDLDIDLETIKDTVPLFNVAMGLALRKLEEV